MVFYTYIWRDANGDPFYVGKGQGKRAYVLDGRSSEFKAIHSQGGCYVEIVDQFILEAQAHAHEMELIERFGRRDFGGLLVNKTDGGEGMSNPSAETRARMSEARKGVPRSPEVREKISASRTGYVSGPHSAEHSAKIGAAHVGMRRSPEARANMSLAQRGRTVSNEAREKLRSINLGKTHSEESRARMSVEKRQRGPYTGKFKGVSRHSTSKKWSASITVGGKPTYLGLFLTPEAAAREYDRAASAAWGADCYLNFPVGD